MIKQLLRKYLTEHINQMVDEAVPMIHFKDRVTEVISDIQSIQLPLQAYIPSIPKETQDAWIISQIKTKLNAKVQAVTDKDYPLTRGSCVLVPLGIVKVQPLKGMPVTVLVTAKRKEGLLTGFSYYITIYENRMPTIVLADPKIPANSSIGNQFIAHLKNTETNGWPVNRDKSFTDKTFMDNIVINMADFKV